tara:strand:- start:253 stop:429 length:177 start_codon:yes stop_codon:yes gene_type:complete
MDKREKVVKKQLVDSYEDFLNSFNEEDLDEKYIVDKDFDLTDDDLSCIRHSSVRGLYI